MTATTPTTGHPSPLFSPLVGAQIELPAGGEAWIELDPAFEHGVLVDRGPVHVTIAALDDEPDDGTGGADPLSVAGHVATLEWSELGYLPVGHEGVRLTAIDGPVRVLLLGGEPFGEEIVMWWNFIGRNHDEVAEFRRQWQADVIGRDNADGRFGTVVGLRRCRAAGARAADRPAEAAALTPNGAGPVRPVTAPFAAFARYGAGTSEPSVPAQNSPRASWLKPPTGCVRKFSEVPNISTFDPADDSAETTDA